jgi:protein-S-isoprenylcysteine O-methyltransferase Ste14
MEAQTSEQSTAGVPFPPPLVYLAGLLIGIGLEIAFPTAALPTAVAIAGAALGIGASLLLDVNAMRWFGRARTPAIPFKPTTALVTDGPYRVTRNPMYLGMAALYAGVAFAFGLLWAFALLPVVLVVIDRVVIAREEPYLERLFGEQYLAYKRRVRRWI